jgi:hypothetical protein
MNYVRILLAIAILLAPPSWALGGADHSQIVELTDRALSAEIDLERNYIQFRLRGSKEPRFRRLRYFLMQEAAAGCYMGSAAIGVYSFGKGLADVENVKSRTLRSSYNVGLIGTALGGSSSAVELSSNALLAIKNKLKHHDPSTAKQRFRQRLANLDSILKERAELVASLDDTKLRQLYEHEGVVLKEFRDWCIYQFADVYADVKSYQASNNVFYVLDIAINSLGAASYLYSHRGLKKPGMYGPSAIVGAVSDSISTVTGPLGTYAGNMIYNFWYNRITKNLKESVHDAEEDCKKAMQNLELLIASSDKNDLAGAGPIVTRLKAYQHWANRYDVFVEERDKHLQFLSKIALQQNVGGPLISMTSLSGDIMNLAGFYRYGQRPIGYNSLSFASSVTQLTAATASATLTASTLVREKRFERKLRESHGLPEQLLEQRLKTLDELDAMLAAAR